MLTVRTIYIVRDGPESITKTSAYALRANHSHIQRVTGQRTGEQMFLSLPQLCAFIIPMAGPLARHGSLPRETRDAAWTEPAVKSVFHHTSTGSIPAVANTLKTSDDECLHRREWHPLWHCVCKHLGFHSDQKAHNYECVSCHTALGKLLF